jgi:hypothetical protein
MQIKTARRYSILHPLYMSFFSKSLYRDVAGNWSGLCFTYLLILISISLVPDMVRLHDRVAVFLTEEAPKVVRQMPTIIISEGNASIREHVPFIIHAPWTKLPFIVIDTLDSAPSQADQKATILLTKTKLRVKSDVSDERSLDLSKIHHLVVDQKLINGWLETFKDYFVFAVLPLALFFAFLYYVVQIFLCAGIGMIFAKKFDIEMPFGALMRLSAVSFTPPLALQTAHSLLDIEFPYSGAISLVLATCYLYFAVGACAERKVLSKG